MLSSGLWKVVSPPPFAHQVAFSTPTHTPGLGPSLILKGELREPPPFFFFLAFCYSLTTLPPPPQDET